MTDGCDPPKHYIDVIDKVRVTAMLELITSYFPHVVSIKRQFDDQMGARLWCGERYGECGRVKHLRRGDKLPRAYLNPHAEWAHTRGYFAFKNRNDAFEFKMRWG